MARSVYSVRALLSVHEAAGASEGEDKTKKEKKGVDKHSRPFQNPVQGGGSRSRSRLLLGGWMDGWNRGFELLSPTRLSSAYIPRWKGREALYIYVRKHTQYIHVSICLQVHSWACLYAYMYIYIYIFTLHVRTSDDLVIISVNWFRSAVLKVGKVEKQID